MQIDQRSLQRLYRMGVKGLNNTHIGKVVRRSKSLRHLINGPLGNMGEEALQLLGMVKDYATGTYRQLPKSTVLAATFALLYVLNPFDIMPDFIPGIGYLDDMSMVALVIGSIRKDLETYSRWRRSRAAISRRLRLHFGIRPRRMMAD